MPNPANRKPLLPRRRGTAACLCWALVWPLLGFAVLAKAPLVAVLAIAAMIPAVITGRSLRTTTRALVYAATAALIVSFVIREVYTIDAERFFFPVELIVPFLATLAVGLLYLEQSPRVIAACLACALAAQLAIGTCLNNPDAFVVAIAPDVLPRSISNALRDRFIVFITAMILQAGGVLMLLVNEEQFARIQRRHSTRVYIKGALVMFTAQLMVFAVGAGSIWGVRILFPKLDALFNPLYREYLRRGRGVRIFPEDANLRQTLDAKRGDDEQQPALYVHGPMPPGYLRGRVYRTYGNGIWTNSGETRALPLDAVGGGVSARRYKESQTPIDDLQQLDIHAAGRFRSDVLFSNGRPAAIELIANSLGRTPDGMLSPKSWDAEGGYSLYFGRLSQTAAWPEPTPADVHLQVPVEIRPELERQVRKIGIPPGSSTEARVRLTAHHLLNNYTYKLNPELPPRDIDPVLYFLETRGNGHCEYFAAAVVLLLRAQGVHARYVTGFVCLENRTDELWIARLGDCHAWAEAWTPTSGWTLVEATPAAGVPGGSDRAGAFAGPLETLKAFAASLYSQVKRGYFAEAVYSLLRGLRDLIVWLFWSGPAYLGWSLLTAALAATGWLLYRRHRARRGPAARQRKLRELSLSLESFLARYGIRRKTTRTLREAARFALSRGVPRAEEFLGYITEYELLRYSRQATPDDVSDFADRFNRWLRTPPGTA